MAIVNIMLKDNKNKVCQKMLFLREDTELLICENINTINKSEPEWFVNIEYIDPDFSTKDMEERGWKINDALYDKLILEYNNKPNIEKLLTMWK